MRKLIVVMFMLFAVTAMAGDITSVFLPSENVHFHGTSVTGPAFGMLPIDFAFNF